MNVKPTKLIIIVTCGNVLKLICVLQFVEFHHGKKYKKQMEEEDEGNKTCEEYPQRASKVTQDSTKRGGEV